MNSKCKKTYKEKNLECSEQPAQEKYAAVVTFGVATNLHAGILWMYDAVAVLIRIKEHHHTHHATETDQYGKNDPRAVHGIILTAEKGVVKGNHASVMCSVTESLPLSIEELL